MADIRALAEREAHYVLRFVETYRQYTDEEKGQREAACLRTQHAFAIMPPEQGDLLLGRYTFPCVGFGMQESGMGYHVNENRVREIAGELSGELLGRFEDAVNYIRPRTGKSQLIAGTPRDVLAVIPNDHFASESNVGFWLCRMSSTQLDFDKLIRLGVSGLKSEICVAMDGAKEDRAKTLYVDMLAALDSFICILREHAARLRERGTTQDERIAGLLEAIAQRRPETFHEAVQLMYLYAVVSGTYNYGRMDEYLGDLLAADLEMGRLTWEEARDILVSLWRLMVQRKTTWNGRVIIGGMGRRNEANADRCVRLILEVADIVRDVLPQLTLRFYKGQDPALYEQALRGIGNGNVYPMLYNDEVNIPSVARAFDISREEAVQYLPFGCGEYVLYHRSVGTPSDVINLLKALEITIFDGYDHVSHRQIGLKTGPFTDYTNFEDFFASYCRQVERYVDVEAVQQLSEYRVARDHSPFLLASVLYDDCIAKGRAIYDGGAVYMGGTLETYGNINTADALTAIRKLVFEEERISKAELMDMLLKNFDGYEPQRQLLLCAPKYGNDDPAADDMALRVHNHICEYTRNQRRRVALDTYLVVVINNSANTDMGRYTMASADGRKAFEPMANANNPSGGSDTNGVTAMMNSLVKLPTDIHAGSVQNIKFSKEMFGRYFEKTKGVLQAYFDNGGAQLMINVLGREDLENALKYPEKYRNLIVRVGGFCARFVELDPDVQREIMSRTMY